MSKENLRIAVISAVLDNPVLCQGEFNDVVSKYNEIIRGRIGIPFKDEGVSVVSLTVLGSMDEINELTGKIGAIDHITVKTAVSKKEVG